MSAVEVVHEREPFLRGFGTAVREIWASRSLLGSLIRKEVSIRYRGSVLGILWAMIKPLTQLLVYGLVLGIFLGFGGQIQEFGFYVFSGLIIFGLFSECATQGSTVIMRNKSLVKKVALRRELLPLSTVGTALVNFSFQVVVLVLAFAVTGHWPDPSGLAYAIPALLIVVMLGTSAAMLLGALNVYVRDVQFIVEVGLMLLFWVTPIVYGWWTVRDALVGRGMDWAFDVYMLNPLTTAAIAFREAAWPGQPPTGYFGGFWSPVLWGTVLGCALLVWFSQRVFNRLQENFAAEL